MQFFIIEQFKQINHFIHDREIRIKICVNVVEEGIHQHQVVSVGSGFRRAVALVGDGKYDGRDFAVGDGTAHVEGEGGVQGAAGAAVYGADIFGCIRQGDVG